MATSSDERKLQTRGVEYIRYTLPHVMVVSVPNELPQPSLPERIFNMVKKFGMLDEWLESLQTQRIITIQNMKRMGMFPGAADLFIFWNHGNGLQIGALETKDKAPQSKNQEKFETAFTKLGGRYQIWRTLPELQRILEGWGLVPIANAPRSVPYTRARMQGTLIEDMMLTFAKEDMPAPKPGSGLMQRLTAAVASGDEAAIAALARDSEPPPGHPAHGDH